MLIWAMKRMLWQGTIPTTPGTTVIRKKIQTEHGESVISIPRDRNGQFEPIAVPKHESRRLPIEKLVISLYAKGMSVSDIEEEMREIYEIELSTSAISSITNKANQATKEWQDRPLDPVYLIVRMDGTVFKVWDNGKIINKTVYLCVGLKQNGLKEVLGMWVGKSESSSFWMGVLTDLKARGVQDILITCTDNLNGFTDTIRTVFPQSSTQICVVHQIRNSCKYVVYKDKKEFTADMKNIYNAPNKEVAAAELENLVTFLFLYLKHTFCNSIHKSLENQYFCPPFIRLLTRSKSEQKINIIFLPTQNLSR